jgi:hypothetical protein
MSGFSDHLHSSKRFALAFGVAVSAAACSAPPGLDTDPDTVPEFGPTGIGAGTATTANAGPGGAAAPAATPSPGAATGSAPPAASSGNTAVTPAAGGSSGASAAAGSGMVGGSAPASSSSNTAGSNTGAAGSASVDGTGGAGAGMAPDEPAAAGGSAANPAPATPVPAAPTPAAPAPATPPPATPAPAAPDIACPAGATFCSGFESGALPAGARFEPTAGTSIEFDTLAHSGAQSILFPAIPDGFNIREVVVPIPGNSFWVRLFMQTDTDFGDNDHDSVFVGSTTMGDNNDEDGVELSEQGNQVLLNSNDQLFSQAGPGFPQGAGPTLTANTWHCMEAFYDGGSGDVQVFADDMLLIDAPSYRTVTYQTFRFGYLQFPGGGARSVWFDDVVVAADRIGCN